MSEVLYQINLAMRIQRFDESAIEARWLYELDDPNGRVQRLVLSAPLHRLLGAFRSPRPLSWTAEQLRTQGWPESAGPELSSLVSARCLPAMLLIPYSVDATEVHCAPVQSDRPGYMSAMLPILRPSVVNRGAKWMQHFFAPSLMAPGVLIVVAGLLGLMRTLSAEGRFASASSMDILLIIGLGTIGVLLHELGHAAAAWRCGARSVSIGIGWYVCFPVAYADLSETWRMSRRARALIDIAGVYLQGLWVAALMACHVLSEHAVFLLAALSASISMLWNLNPFLRMDGYWLVSDLLGIPNLRETARLSLAHAWNRIRGRGFAQKRGRLGPKTAAALLSYGVLSSLFFAWMISAAANHFGQSALQTVPAYVQRLWHTDWSGLSAADGLVLVGSLFWQIFMLLALARLLQVTATRWWQRWKGIKPFAQGPSGHPEFLHHHSGSIDQPAR
jgi:putative peptide zinc metalloprotease protein